MKISTFGLGKDTVLTFSLVCQLLRHEGLHLSYANCPDLLRFNTTRWTNRMFQVAEAFDGDWRGGIRTACEAFEAPVSRLRSGGMRLRSWNGIAANYRPPEAHELAKKVRQIWVRAASSSDISAALEVFLDFLTVHPLPDGNGRVARGIFASLLVRIDAVDPRLLIALVIMFSRRGEAIQHFLLGRRAGIANVLAVPFQDALSATDGFLGAHIGPIKEALVQRSWDEACKRYEALREDLLLFQKF